jgi:trimeric autotransporter adhesin
MRRVEKMLFASWALSSLAFILILPMSGVQAQAQSDLPGSPEPLVKGAVEDATRVTLGGNVHPLARPEFDQGRVGDSLTGDRLYLILKRSSQQEQDLQQFLRDAHTPGADSYHKWLTPVEFGKRFGPADSDIAAVTAWLESHGLAVAKVHPGRVAIEFSGNAAQLTEAFRTEIHSYNIHGQTQIANSSNPQIPAAFAALIAGVSPLHSFHAQPMIKVSGRASYNRKTHQATPDWTYPSGAGSTVFELAPSDFATQYDLGPVYAAGTTGAGQSIGILSASNVDLSLVQAYQKLFGLTANLPAIVVDGNDPGENEAAAEAYLDIELAGAVAPAANVVVYTSAGSILTDPLLTSGMRAIEDNRVSVISMSYGICEVSLGASGNALWSSLWQEAAAQGITVFVSAGDSGSAGCDNFDVQEFAESGLAVNGLGSTPYNVSVGGTDFYYSDFATPGSTLSNQIGSYWSTGSSTTPTTSLLQPAPEQVWNDPFGMNAGDDGVYNAANSTIVAGGGGASSAAVYPSSGPATGYPKPLWQTGPGVPADMVRDLPDVSLYAADGLNYVYYPVCAYQGDCVNTTSAGAVEITSAGGTSASAPAMAGIQALVDQAQNSRQGLANYVYYALAAQVATATAFHDITVGGNQVPCYQGTSNCLLGTTGPANGFYAESGYPATVGYDRASGLGSVDVAKLIADWPTVAFKPSKTTLTISPTTFAHGATVTMKATVTGVGTPTGNVVLDTTDPQTYANGLGVFALTSGIANSSIDNLPGGTYQVMAQYSGDGAFSASTSAPVLVTVTPEADTLSTLGWVLNPTDDLLYPLSAGMSIPYGAEVYIDAKPTGVTEATSTSGQAAPSTGSVTFTDKVGTISNTTAVALNSVGIAEWSLASPAIGSHVIGAAYAGDASYDASTAASAATLTVFKGTTTMHIYPLETNVVAGNNVTVDVELYSDYLPLTGALPTGNVTITLGSQTITIALESWGSAGQMVLEGVVTFTKVPAGILPLTASYVGDANWNGCSSLFGSVIALASKAAPAVTLTAPTTAFTPTQVVTMTGTVTGATGSPRPSGSLYFTWEDGSLSYVEPLQPGATASAATFTLSFPASQLANGNNFFVATFNGDANYSAQSSAPLVITLNGSDFTLTTTTPEVAVKTDGTATGTVTVSPLNAYSGTVAITCSAPAGITCTAATASPTVSAAVSDVITFKVASTVAAGIYPALVTAAGGGRTHTAQVLVANAPPAASPAFLPAAGTYITPQTVTIQDATPGAVVFYTTDGSAPGTASAQYVAPIAVGVNETLKAIAIAPGYSLSAAASGAFTITPPAATPTFSLAAGTYLSAQTVTIADATSGATVYYTVNGTTPTTASTKYTAPIVVSATETLKAIAIATGFSLSIVASASYTITPPAATPTFSPAAGTYTAAQTVKIADATPGAAVYYTIDGTTPTTSSPKYTAPIVVSTTETLKAVAIATGFSLSDVSSAAYTIAPAAAAPTFSPVGGSYLASQTVTIVDTTVGATIYYTVDGTTPTTSSTKYTAPFKVTTTETVNAVAVAPDFAPSLVGSVSYAISSHLLAPRLPIIHVVEAGDVKDTKTRR